MELVTNTIHDVKSLIVILVNNNPVGVINSLNRHGYPTDQGASLKELNNTLNLIYTTDPQTFWAIVGEIRYNRNADNFTTNEEFVQSLINYRNRVNPSSAYTRESSDIENIFTGIGDFLGGSEQTDKTTTTTETGKSNLPIIIGAAILGIIILTIILVKMK